MSSPPKTRTSSKCNLEKDVGVTRALARWLTVPLTEGTSLYGETFEHLVILECIKLATYFELDYRFSYLQTKEGAKIDLVVERPGLPHLFIEIKSSHQVDESSLKSLKKITASFTEPCEAVCFSQDPFAKQYDTLTVLPWKEGVRKYFYCEK